MSGKYTPINPVALSSATSSPQDLIEGSPVISGLKGSNQDLIAEASRLWISPDDIVLDMTWGVGAFWGTPPTHTEDGILIQPQIRHDRAIDGVDCRALPEASETIDVVVFDPPYRPNHGGQSAGLYDNYRLGESGLDSMNDVIDLYNSGIQEAFRVLKPGGRIFVKTQDMTYTSRLHLVTLDVLRSMLDAGFEFSDQFVLVNTSRRPHNSTATTGAGNERLTVQRKARRAHSVLWIGTKPDYPTSLTNSLDKLVDKFGVSAVDRALDRKLKLSQLGA